MILLAVLIPNHDSYCIKVASMSKVEFMSQVEFSLRTTTKIVSYDLILYDLLAVLIPNHDSNCIKVVQQIRRRRVLLQNIQ
jgi:hypothetical protein